MPIQLIINADDYGRTPGVSLGIREAHLHGVVTSTTVMMNMPGVEKALEQAMLECPHLGLGVHLVLTSGKPLSPLSCIRSLTLGSECFPRLEVLIGKLDFIDPDEVRSEWETQIKRFITITGRTPDHLDSHHHTSYYPPLFQTMLELAQQYDCAIRSPIGNENAACLMVLGDLPEHVAAMGASEVIRLLDLFNPIRPQRLITSFYDTTVSLDYLLESIKNLPGGTSEIMTHPGRVDAELIAGSTYNHQRTLELAILTNKDVGKLVRKMGIELINFTHLRR